MLKAKAANQPVAMPGPNQQSDLLLPPHHGEIPPISKALDKETCHGPDQTLPCPARRQGAAALLCRPHAKSTSRCNIVTRGAAILFYRIRVKPRNQKYSACKFGKSELRPFHPAPFRGASAVVTTRGG